MTKLKGTIEALANTFASNIIAALRTASIDELAEFTGGRRATVAVSHTPPTRAPAAEPASSSKSSAPAKRAPRAKGGRLGRRSAGDIAQMIDSIVSAVSKSPNGLRAEQIRSALGVEAKELPRPLADAVSAGRLTKTGQKRATTYFAGSSGRRGKKGR